MALCCIGGVCVPYSAIVPLAILGLKWLLERLVSWGLIPSAWVEGLNRLLMSGNLLVAPPANDPTTSSKKSPPFTQESSCCSSKSSITSDEQGKNQSCVRQIDSEDDWKVLLVQSQATPVIVKFCAEWCQPCKRIHPLFCSLAAEDASKTIFATVDVDDLDRVAAEHRIAILPTFAVFHRGLLVRRYTGSDESSLTDFIRRDDPPLH